MVRKDKNIKDKHEKEIEILNKITSSLKNIEELMEKSNYFCFDLSLENKEQKWKDVLSVNEWLIEEGVPERFRYMDFESDDGILLSGYVSSDHRGLVENKEKTLRYIRNLLPYLNLVEEIMKGIKYECIEIIYPDFDLETGKLLSFNVEFSGFRPSNNISFSFTFKENEHCIHRMESSVTTFSDYRRPLREDVYSNTVYSSKFRLKEGEIYRINSPSDISDMINKSIEEYTEELGKRYESFKNMVKKK